MSDDAAGVAEALLAWADDGRHSNGDAQAEPLEGASSATVSAAALSGAEAYAGVANDADATGSGVENDEVVAGVVFPGVGLVWNSRWATRCCRASTDSDFRSVAASMNVRISSAKRSGSQPPMTGLGAASFLPSSLPKRPRPFFCSMSAAVEASCGMVCVWM